MTIQPSDNQQTSAVPHELQQQILTQAQQALQQHQQELQTLDAQQTQEEEQWKQAQIQALQQQVNLDLSPELQQFLSVGYKIHQSGRGTSVQEYAIATIQMPDEHDQIVTGYLLYQLVNPEGREHHPGYRIILPDLSVINAKTGRGVYQDLSGGINHYCYRADLNTLLLRLIGEWYGMLDKLKQDLKVEQQRIEQLQQEQQQRQQEKQQQKELEAQQEAERQTISDQIQALLNPILQSTITWTEGDSVTCYQWKWAIGAAIGEDGELHIEYDSCFSFNDTLDLEDYIIPVEGRPIKLETGCYPRVYRTIINSLSDCELYGLLETRPPLIIDGISEAKSSYEQPRQWQWGGCYTHHWIRKTLPVRWIREAVGYERITIHIKLNRPEDDTSTAGVPQ